MSTFLGTIQESHKLYQERTNEALRTVEELVKTKTADYGPVAEILDLIGELTGYSTANLPLNEKSITTRILVKLIRLMNIQAKGNPNFESAIDECKDIIGETARLYASMVENKPIVNNNSTKEA